MERGGLGIGLKINGRKTKMMIVIYANHNSPEVLRKSWNLILNTGGCVLDEVKQPMAVSRIVMDRLKKLRPLKPG